MVVVPFLPTSEIIILGGVETGTAHRLHHLHKWLFIQASVTSEQSRPDVSMSWPMLCAAVCCTSVLHGRLHSGCAARSVDCTTASKHIGQLL